MFFMRIQWELEKFLIPREKIFDYIDTLYALRYKMTFNLYFTDERPRMAIFVSKMSHCLYDLLARWKAGEWDVDIPCIVSNHEDLRYVAEQFNIPYYVWSIKKDHSNKAEVEQAEMERKCDLYCFGSLYADYLRRDDSCLSEPYHQYSPLILACICGCQALPSGVGTRREDYRCNKSLRNS